MKIKPSLEYTSTTAAMALGLTPDSLNALAYLNDIVRLPSGRYAGSALLEVQRLLGDTISWREAIGEAERRYGIPRKVSDHFQTKEPASFARYCADLFGGHGHTRAYRVPRGKLGELLETLDEFYENTLLARQRRVQRERLQKLYHKLVANAGKRHLPAMVIDTAQAAMYQAGAERLLEEFDAMSIGCAAEKRLLEQIVKQGEADLVRPKLKSASRQPPRSTQPVDDSDRVSGRDKGITLYARLGGRNYVPDDSPPDPDDDSPADPDADDDREEEEE